MALNFYNLNNLINESVKDLIELSYKLGITPREEIEKIMKMGEKQNFYYLDRDEFTLKLGWSIPCKEAVDAIKKYVREPLYDAMAGTGFWSKVLNLNGIKTIAHDIHKNPNKNTYHGNRWKDKESGKSHINIKRKNALKLGLDLKNQRIKGDVFLSWPPYNCVTANILADMLPIGTRLFYVGEGAGGCTGDHNFHKNLDTNFRLIDKVYLPNFPGIHDDLYIYEKIKNDPLSQEKEE